VGVCPRGASPRGFFPCYSHVIPPWSQPLVTCPRRVITTGSKLVGAAPHRRGMPQPLLRTPGRYGPSMALMLVLLVAPVSAFLAPPGRSTLHSVGGVRPPVRATHGRLREGRARGLVRCYLTDEEKGKVTAEFEAELNGGSILKTLEVLRKHRTDVDLDWDKVSHTTLSCPGIR
jgi:hypothetical protein